jgi:DNA polymerase-1
MLEYGLDEKQIKRAMTHKALNAKIQGSAADMMKQAMVNIWESGLLDSDALRISITVHDELDGSVEPSPRGQEIFKEIQRIMETAMPIEVPVLTEGKTGKSWAETH